jgi:multicomponent Na+:H+ antiporter subunit D
MAGRAFNWLARKPVQAIDTLVGEVYRFAGLVPLMISARLAGAFDNKVIDGLVDGVATTVAGFGKRLKLAQRGQVQESLAFAFAAAAVLMVAFVILVKS